MEMRPAHILMECPDLIASVRVGVLDALSHAEKLGKCSLRFVRTAQICKKDIEWCDVFICVRGFTAPSEELVRIAKRAKRFCVYFLDDDLADIPADIPSADFAIKLNAGKRIQEILSQTDVLWTVNPLLAKKYGKWCPRAITARVPANVSTFSTEKFFESRVNILYAGSSDHTELVRNQISPAVRRLNEEFPDKYSFTFIGADPDLRDVHNVKFIPYIDSYDKYKSVVKEGRYSIGLAPIKEGFFYQCKYYNKFIEYASMGIVGIYADKPPYTQIVEENRNGFLCDGSPEAWRDAVIRAESDRMSMERCARNAADLLGKDFSPEKVCELVCTGIPELIHFRAEPDVVKWPIIPPALAYYKERFLYNLKIYGILAFGVIIFKICRKVWRHFRKRQ